LKVYCNPKETTMKKLALTSACILALSTAGAFAQSSQGKAGSDNGPISNSPTTNGSGSNAGMSGNTAGAGSTMRNDGTTGAGTGSSAPSSQGNVGPGTNNNSATQPGGR
jgi:hypothetical protein